MPHRPHQGQQTHGKLRPMHIGHTGHFGQDTTATGPFRQRPSTRETLANAHRPSVAATKHTGNFGQDTSAIGPFRQRPSTRETSANAHRPSVAGPSIWETLAKAHRPSVAATKHTGNFGQCTSAIGRSDQAHGKLWPRHIGHRSQRPSTRETSAKAHRPPVSKHMGNFGQCTSAIGQHTGNFGQDTSAIGHHTHRKLPEGAKAHRPSVNTRETSANAHRPSVAATKHTGNFGQDTSAIGRSDQSHWKLWPMHIGHRLQRPGTRETSAMTHRPSVAATKHTGNFGQGTSAIGHQTHGTLLEGAPSGSEGTSATPPEAVPKHTGQFDQDTSATPPEAVAATKHTGHFASHHPRHAPDTSATLMNNAPMDETAEHTSGIDRNPMNTTTSSANCLQSAIAFFGPLTRAI